MSKSLYAFEERLAGEGLHQVAGVDEAGRGPLAGPVVAGAVMLPQAFRIKGLNDSKQLSPKVRESLFAQILESCKVGVGLVSERGIDEVNIFQATRLAMQKAVLNLPHPPQALLIDGRMHLDLDFPKMEIIHGDALSASIAAASIVAKVMRDHIMLAYDQLAPFFSFKAHKGYGTRDHLLRLRERGPSTFHRRSFQPVKELLHSRRRPRACPGAQPQQAVCSPRRGYSPWVQAPRRPLGAAYKGGGRPPTLAAPGEWPSDTNGCDSKHRARSLDSLEVCQTRLGAAGSETSSLAAVVLL